MVSSISLDWAACYVAVISNKGGWSQLINVPVVHVAATVERLKVIGATSVTVVGLNSIRFQLKATQAAILCNVFPSCPLSSKLS